MHIISTYTNNTSCTSEIHYFGALFNNIHINLLKLLVDAAVDVNFFVSDRTRRKLLNF